MKLGRTIYLAMFTLLLFLLSFTLSGNKANSQELYVTSFSSSQVLGYNGATGAFIDAFVTAGSGGLDSPEGLAFRPDGNLYVVSQGNNQILRYNGATGAFIDAVVTA
ncbi:MAG: hypothetical protein AB7V12_04175, partial [Candidatus Dadabacteria bacterium]